MARRFVAITSGDDKRPTRATVFDELGHYAVKHSATTRSARALAEPPGGTMMRYGEPHPRLAPAAENQNHGLRSRRTRTNSRDRRKTAPFNRH